MENNDPMDFNPRIDPFDLLETLQKNQQILNHNQQSMLVMINDLAQTIRSQQQQLDHLRQGLDCANKVNELMLANSLEGLVKQGGNH